MKITRKEYLLDKLSGKIRGCLEEYNANPETGELFILRLILAEKIKALINVRRLPLMRDRVDETNPLGEVAKRVNRISVRHSEMNIQTKADFYRECQEIVRQKVDQLPTPTSKE